MTYANLLSTFWIVVSVLLFCLLRKKGVFEKILFRVLFVTVILLLWVSTSLLPVENWLFTFESPESAFQYREGRGEIHGILYGNDSYMIAFSDSSGSFRRFIAHRSEDGYKLPSVFGMRRVARVGGAGGHLDVNHVRNTDDFYIVGLKFLDGGELSVYDRDGVEISEMTYVLVPMHSDSYVVYIAMFVESFTDDFYFYINGERMDIVR